MSRREEILNGELHFPIQILNDFIKPQTEQETGLVLSFFQGIWVNYLREKDTDTITWFLRFDNPKLFNLVLMHLSKAGWITSTVGGNYANITLNESKLEQWVTKEELINVKFIHKFIKYRLSRTQSIYEDLVQLNHVHTKTGLVRKGFMKAGNNVFKYDTKYLKKYTNQIIENIQKGLGASSKDITYQEIQHELVNYYAVDGTEYTLGNNIIDSRGRAIFQCSKKVFNPVGSKDARALLVCEPEPLHDINVVYAAISELCGYKGKDYADKVHYGACAYIVRELPSIEYMEYTSNYDDLHKRIWLERIYEALDKDNYQQWDVPIEIDATASMLQMVGVLTNDYEYMDRTNLIGDTFKDAWTVEYVSREHVKKALTPQLYGSGKKAKDLWDKNKLEYTQVQLNKINDDLEVGVFSNANRFKEFIINNVQPQTKMKVRIWDEEFYIECNRFKWEETTHVTYPIYTSQQGLVKRVARTLNLVPDVNQFKRYFVTLLIHNLDSQIANTICEEVQWVLPNHDAFIIHPNDASLVRSIYIEKMKNIHTNRKSILRNYFNSIGIVNTYEESNEQMGDLEFSPYCLK